MKSTKKLEVAENIKLLKSAILILSLLLLISLSYIAHLKITSLEREAFLRGYTYGQYKGFEYAVSSLYEQTEDCKIASITYKNKTRKVVDLNCVNALLNKLNVSQNK